ncbi:hypothetical protein CHS0354_007758 [Potamilus streckersoni]|uniref:EF-hand domain-containing protein n=1 Tax=Potamilus streckersoni TaxID=2493646 RepID=A0AAE0VI56_9BIVA|nr:hypothetical protein CHS0354_007758 [Potamilus streckersoni]
MAQGLTKDQIEEYREAFNLFDKDGSGHITTEELGVVMRNLGQSPTQEELEQMVREVDKNGNGTVEFSEFVAMMGRMMSSEDKEENLLDAFKSFDRDGNGLISREELKQALISLGDQPTDQQVADMMDEVDLNGDGYINYEEFLKIMDFK